MSLSITTINNEAAVAKTFTKLFGNDKRTEWINSSDSDETQTIKLAVAQSILGKTPTGRQVRRTLVQVSATAPVVQVVNGMEKFVDEQFIANLTLTGPEQFSTTTNALTATDRHDCVAYIRNLVTAAFVTQLVRGEL
jgi:hypothetical protein